MSQRGYRSRTNCSHSRSAEIEEEWSVDRSGTRRKKVTYPHSFLAVPLESVDESLDSLVVADQVFGSSEEEDGNLLEQGGEETDGGRRLVVQETASDGVVALDPAGLVVGRVEGGDYV
jgi:hypothetical protein